MASVGHIAIGMAAARVYHGGRVPSWSSMALWSAVSLVPDADVLGFALGVEYADAWGHRGAAHSLTASLALGVLAGLAARWCRRPARRAAFCATAVLASHALLDTMTDGGLGCALFWPFDLSRYFAPWRPIPVAPIGLAFFSTHGAIIAFTELLLFSPATWFSLRPWRAHPRPVATGLVMGIWVVCVWLLASSDPTRDAIVGFVLREDTVYPRGFSEEAFRRIRPGASDQDVRQALGAPFAERWLYPPPDRPRQSAETTSAASLPYGCHAVNFEDGVLATTRDADACHALGVDAGMSPVDVRRILGSPPESCWQYSRGGRSGHYRMRIVCFSRTSVETVIRRWERESLIAHP